MEFESKNKLIFEVAPCYFNIDKSNDWMLFRVGSCTGMFCCNKKSYDILAIENKVKGNGHFDDVLQWFENSSKRDNKMFRILEVWNEDFKNHLINKRGFKEYSLFNLEKKCF